MTAHRVLEVLRLLESMEVAPVVDGGWGLDALVGAQTRDHGDLDLVLTVADAERVVPELTTRGWRVVRDLRPTAIALVAPDGCEVDLHPITPTADGGGDQSLAGDPAWTGAPTFHYGAPAQGVIAGVAVRCVDAAGQLEAHRGYPIRPRDRADVGHLVARSGLPLPPEYRRPKEG